VSTPSIRVIGAGKRYVKYDDTPMLVTRIARLHTRTKRSRLWAVRACSFSVADGEIIGIIGRNGSGKSTLLRMLAGVTGPTEGLVAVRGRVAPLIAVGVGFHPELTGRENVYINGTVLGLSRKQIDRRFDEIVDFAEIEAFIDTPVKFYSSGMFVRLGFAVSVLADPDVLIVDEVLAVGDIAFQLKCMDRMLEIQRSGVTLVVVSHNLSAIRNMCKRTLVMHDGELRHDGETTEAISLYHDLLGETREIEGESLAMPGGEGFDPRAVINQFKLLDSQNHPTNHVHSGDDVTFSVDLKFVQATESPILGFFVFNEAGVQVYGESTEWRGGASYRAGDQIRASIRIQPKLVTGSYSAGVGLMSAEGVALAPAVRPILFYVGGRHGVNGVADLGATFEVKTVAPQQSEKTG
jgi:ABC-type polysaccharide/polyol phosphate transport system ATPase subunit